MKEYEHMKVSQVYQKGLMGTLLNFFILMYRLVNLSRTPFHIYININIICTLKSPQCVMESPSESMKSVSTSPNENRSKFFCRCVLHCLKFSCCLKSNENMSMWICKNISSKSFSLFLQSKGLWISLENIRPTNSALFVRKAFLISNIVLAFCELETGNGRRIWLIKLIYFKNDTL